MGVGDCDFRLGIGIRDWDWGLELGIGIGDLDWDWDLGLVLGIEDLAWGLGAGLHVIGCWFGGSVCSRLVWRGGPRW